MKTQIFKVKVTNYISEAWYTTFWDRKKGKLERPNGEWTPKVNGESIIEVFGPFGWQSYHDFEEDFGG